LPSKCETLSSNPGRKEGREGRREVGRKKERKEGRKEALFAVFLFFETEFHYIVQAHLEFTM
jgi:hypothetical protein